MLERIGRSMLALGLGLGLGIGVAAPACKREAAPRVTVKAELWIAPLAEDHPWVVAFLTELASERREGVEARLEGRAEPDGRRVPEPIFAAAEREDLTELLADYEARHPRPPELVPVWERFDPAGPLAWRLHFIDRSAGFELDDDASATLGQGQRKVILHLSPSQRETFAELTRAGIGRRVGFVLDDEVLAVPVIRSPIPGGEVELPSDPAAGPRGASTLLERLGGA